MTGLCTVCGLFAFLFTCRAAYNTTDNNCVSDYEEFEKKTFSDNTHNKYMLYKVFYPQNQHLPYAVDISYRTVLPNGEELEITDSGCNTTKWRWISSPIFLFIAPHTLNSLSMLTMNYFKEWTTPTVTLIVPPPCPNTTYDFLLLMTSLGDDYALGRYGATTPSQSAYRRCNNMYSANSGIDEFKAKDNIVIWLGGLFGITLVVMGYVLALKWNLKDMVELSYQYSYRHYGLWWGVTCFGVIAVSVGTYEYIREISLFGSNKLLSFNTWDIIQILVYVTDGITALPGIPIAVYLTYKTKPPAVPYIILVPVTISCCCCSTKRAKSLVFGVAMWFALMTVIIGVIHGLCIILAILAEPFAVITNTLALFLGIFCVINILALLFTISAYIFTRKHLRPQGQGKTMLRAVLLIPLLAMITCLCISIGSLGYLINQNARQGNALSLLSSSVCPIILGAVTFGLKRLITKWLESPPKRLQRECEDSKAEEVSNIVLLP